MRRGFVYILASESGTLYIGVTNDLDRRIREHKDGLIDGFAKRYECKRLLYFEAFEDVRNAIARETQLKGWRREKKVGLIVMKNPGWVDWPLGGKASFGRTARAFKKLVTLIPPQRSSF